MHPRVPAAPVRVLGYQSGTWPTRCQATGRGDNKPQHCRLAESAHGGETPARLGASRAAAADVRALGCECYGRRSSVESLRQDRDGGLLTDYVPEFVYIFIADRGAPRGPVNTLPTSMDLEKSP